jgi:hypothetical protein
MNKTIYDKINSLLQSQSFINTHKNSENDFTRNRVFTFKTLFLFLCNNLVKSTQKELNDFFKVLHGNNMPVKEVDKSAFTKARKKLKFSAFVEIMDNINKIFYGNKEHHLWKNLRLIAIDGTRLNVPVNNETCSYFRKIQTKKNYKPYVIATASIAYDVLNNMAIDGLINNNNQGERSLSYLHLNKLKQGDLVLADRGYPSFYFFRLMRSSSIEFCVRVKEAESLAVRKFVASGSNDKIIELHAHKYSFKYHPDSHLSREPIKIRLIKVPLDNGTFEILCTSLLDEKLYPYECFKELYAYRWLVEEEYKTFKCRLQLENFSGKSVLSIYQDFYAKCLMSNLTSIMNFTLEDDLKIINENRKSNYKICFSQALGKMKNNYLFLFIKKYIMKYLKIIQEMFLEDLGPIRPNRSNKRKGNMNKTRYHPSYKSNI